MTISKTQAVVDAAAALQAAAAELGLGMLSEDELSMLLGQAFGESMFGRAVPGYKLDMAGTNNWGSVQSTASWESKHAADRGFGKFAHTDTHSDGTPYVGWFRVYPNQLQGALGFLSTVLYGGAAALQAAIAGGTASYAGYLKDYGYYEASIEQYTQMLANGQADMLSQLSAGSGLIAASPTANLGESIAPVAERVAASLLPVSPSSGIVMFVSGISPAVVGLAAVVGSAAWLSKEQWWPVVRSFWDMSRRKIGL